MHIYLRIQGFPLVIPYEALQALGNPHHISFAYNISKNRLMIFRISRPRPDMGHVTIPDIVYRKQIAFAVESANEFKELVLYLSDTSGLNNYIVSTHVVAAGTDNPRKKALNKMVSGKPVLFVQMSDAETFQEAGITECPKDLLEIYTTGAQRVR